MKNYLYMLVLFCIFQGCKSQNIKSSHFIYHYADYYLGNIYEERVYNSLTGLYEYKEYNDRKEVVRNIRIFLKLSAKDLEDINKLYSFSTSEVSDCYYENMKLTHKSTIIFNSQKDNFDVINCNKNENPTFVKIEDKIEEYITSSNIYKKTFYWENYKK